MFYLLAVLLKSHIQGSGAGGIELQQGHHFVKPAHQPRAVHTICTVLVSHGGPAADTGWFKSIIVFFIVGIMVVAWECNVCVRCMFSVCRVVGRVVGRYMSICQSVKYALIVHISTKQK